MKEIIQKDLFAEILRYQSEYGDNAPQFQHGLDERERIINSDDMASFYGPIIQRLINCNYLEGNLPLFGNIMLSTINRCNGHCSFCGANVERENRPLRRMSDELLDRIIDECAQIHYCGRLTMEGLNEPFLDCDMRKRILWIHDKIPLARIHLITNGTMLKDETLVSIYPAVEKIHVNEYDGRGKNQIQDALANVYKLPDGGKKVKFTSRIGHEVLAQFGNNQCGRTYSPGVSCSCILPFNTLSILPDGKVNLCIADMSCQYCLGSLENQSMVEIWYGEKAEQYRKIIATGRKACTLCRHCDMFCF